MKRLNFSQLFPSLSVFTLAISAANAQNALPQLGLSPDGVDPVVFEFRTEKAFFQNGSSSLNFTNGQGVIRITEGIWNFTASATPIIGDTTLYYAPVFNPFIDTADATSARILRLGDSRPGANQQLYSQGAVQPFLSQINVTSLNDYSQSNFNDGPVGSITRRTPGTSVLGWRDRSARFWWRDGTRIDRTYTYAEYDISNVFLNEGLMNDQFPGGAYTFSFPASYQTIPVNNTVLMDVFRFRPQVFDANWENGAIEFDYGFFSSLNFGYKDPGSQTINSFLRQYTGTTAAAGLGDNDGQNGGDSMRILIRATSDGARFFPSGPAQTIVVTAPDLVAPVRDAPNTPPRSVQLGDEFGNLVVSTAFPGPNGFLSVQDDPANDSNLETDNYATLGVGDETLDSSTSGNESMNFSGRTAIVPDTIVFSLFRGNDRCIIEALDAETGELLTDIIDVADTEVIDIPAPAELNQFAFATSPVFAGRPLESLTIKAQSATESGNASFGFWSLTYRESLDFGGAIGSPYETVFNINPFEFFFGTSNDGQRQLVPGEELEMTISYIRERSSTSNLFASSASSTNRLVVPLRPIEGYRSFSALQFGIMPDGGYPPGAKPTDDFDNDGRSNLREFVAGSNPRLSDADPVGFISQDFLPDGRISFIVAKPDSFGSSINYTPEVSTDMVNYTVITPNDPDWIITEQNEQFIVTSVDPVPGAVFMRFKFSIND